MAKTKSDFDVVTKGFIQYLEKSGQLSKLPHLAKEHINISRTLFDPNLAVVYTVIKLDKAEVDALEAKLQTVFKRPITVQNKIAKNILGGMLIRLGDQIIDLSLKTRITSVEQSLYS